MLRIDSKPLAEKIRETTGKKRPARSSIIKSGDGTIFTVRTEALRRSKDYAGKLYQDGAREEPVLVDDNRAPSILISEVELAFRCMEKRKAEGIDENVLEVVNVLEDFEITKITNIVNKIYRKGVVPERMKDSEFIVIPKREGGNECCKYRTNSIMSQVGKIILKLIDEMTKRKVMEYNDE